MAYVEYSLGFHLRSPLINARPHPVLGMPLHQEVIHNSKVLSRRFVPWRFSCRMCAYPGVQGGLPPPVPLNQGPPTGQYSQQQSYGPPPGQYQQPQSALPPPIPINQSQPSYGPGPGNYTSPPPQHTPYSSPPPQHSPYSSPPPQHSPYSSPPPQHSPYAQPLVSILPILFTFHPSFRTIQSSLPPPVPINQPASHHQSQGSFPSQNFYGSSATSSASSLPPPVPIASPGLAVSNRTRSLHAIASRSASSTSAPLSSPPPPSPPPEYSSDYKAPQRSSSISKGPSSTSDGKRNSNNPFATLAPAGSSSAPSGLWTFTFKSSKPTPDVDKRGRLRNNYILDSTAAGYRVESDAKKKHSTLSGERGDVLATFDWTPTISPLMMFMGGRQMKCREWLPYRPERNSRMFAHEGRTYVWIKRDGVNIVRCSPFSLSLPVHQN
ncbi:hypothetical protein OF83DRAFT_456625 [Amylostereum chailletii]|nr:hypothetical protein OF83DRAFT_456625 [Amylostereum chailletii]